MHIATIWKFRTVQVYSVVPHTNHMTDHPITPSPELVRQWQRKANHNEPLFSQVANQAAQWGADQELEACCEWLELNSNYTRSNHLLRTIRRPKPPTLKEQALKALKVLPTPAGEVVLDITDVNTIRRALEAQLDD